MRWTIFTNANGIVRKNVDVRQTGKRGQTNRGTAIISENEKRCARRAEHSVIGNTVQNRAHTVFANAEVNVTTFRRVARKIATVLNVVQGRSVEVSAAADEQRHRLR